MKNGDFRVRYVSLPEGKWCLGMGQLYPYFDGLYHPFTVNFGMVYYCSTKINPKVESFLQKLPCFITKLFVHGFFIHFHPFSATRSIARSKDLTTNGDFRKTHGGICP